MRDIPAAFAARIDGEATTLATAFVVRLADGTVLGFTDHDRPLTVAGVTCRPDSGFTGSDATRHAGFAVGEEEVAGALSSEFITEADLAAGRWDGATIEVWRLDWTSPADGLLLRTGRLGEVTERDGAFRAELRGPAHALEQVRGRLYSRFCDAVFGDGRCGADTAAWRRAATVAAGSDARVVRLTGIDDLAAGWLARGTCRFDGGTLAGRSFAVDDHVKDVAGSGIILRRPLPAVPEQGVAVTLTAGCDKQFATCRDRFGNADNFRGFPHMPGRDFVFSFASGESGGEVLFR
jgi:uncharacterized phage protein (TIGR02218 family)